MSLEAAHAENTERLMVVEAMRDQLDKQLEDGKRQWRADMSRMHEETASWEAKYNAAIAQHHAEMRKHGARYAQLEEKEKIAAQAQLALAQLWIKWQGHNELWADNTKVNVGNSLEICAAMDELLLRMSKQSSCKLLQEYGIISNRIWNRHFVTQANPQDLKRFSPLYVFEATEKLCASMDAELKRSAKTISSLEKQLAISEDRAARLEREVRALSRQSRLSRPSTAPPQRPSQQRWEG
jgi:hypothetical protein